MTDMAELSLHHARYVRSNGYDPMWVTANQMGPNALWLTESLTEVLAIEPGAKVLDLGCGKVGGRIGVVMPATTRELGEEIPSALERFWDWEFCCWHTPEWWRTHWAKTRKVTVDQADLIEDGWRDWLQFNDFIAPHVQGWWVDEVASTHDFLMTDQGTEIGFARVVATKR